MERWTHNPEVVRFESHPRNQQGDIMSEIKVNSKKIPNVPTVKPKGAVKPVQAKTPIKAKMNVMRKAGRGR